MGPLPPVHQCNQPRGEPTCLTARTRQFPRLRPKPTGRCRTRTGGPTRSTCRCSISTRPDRTRWARTFDYKEAFKSLDVDALKRDLITMMTTSQEWWPADYGHYGPLFIRMTWHAAGTYRTHDGRGGGGEGAQRFAPLNSWPDNANLDKARRLLWPIKQKYGSSVSWADLLVLAGNVAMESMGFKTFGFGFGRPDIWEPDEVFWGPEDTWLGDERYSGERDLANPLGAVQMGLIYVNPEGPNGNPDPLKAAIDIRETFARMAMNDEETAALDHRRPHVRQVPRRGEPRVRRSRARGVPGRGARHRLAQQLRHRRGRRHAHERPRGRVDEQPDPVGQRVPRQPLQVRLGARRTSPAGAQQWTPKNPEAQDTVPDAHDPSKRHAPMMLTTDLALRDGSDLRADREALPREPRSARRRVREGPGTSCCTATWARSRATSARGSPSRSCGKTRCPRSTTTLIGDADIAALKGKILDSGLSVSQLVSTAWSAAASFRGTDKRGGANGARIRLAPQKDWEVERARPSSRRCCRHSRRCSRTSTAAGRPSRSPT